MEGIFMLTVDKNLINKIKAHISKHIASANKILSHLNYFLEISGNINQKAAVYSEIDKFSIYIRDFESIYNSISPKGMTEVTFGLLRFRMITNKYGYKSIYLLLSGIKLNGEKKDEKECDKVEKELLYYERRLANFIEDDFTIKAYNIAEFINYFEAYFRTFFEKKNIKQETNEGYDKELLYCIDAIISYVLYTIQSKLLTVAGHMILEGYFKDLMKYDCVTAGAAAKIVLYEFLKTTKEDFFVRIIGDEDEPVIPAKESSSEKVKKDTSAPKKDTPAPKKDTPAPKKDTPAPKKDTTTPKKDNLTPQEKALIKLNGYLKEGIVYDTAEFEKLLNETDLPNNRKLELLAQMRNYNNRILNENRQRELENLRNDILFDEERVLYDRAKKIKSDERVLQIVKDIDAIFEMLLEDIDIEDRDDFIKELNSQFNYLSTILNSKEENTKETSIPNLAYFMDCIETEDGIKKVPRILTSIRTSKKSDYKSIYNELNKLLSGLVRSDYEYTEKNLPCRIFYRGKNYLLFYALIGKTVVVIDSLKKENAEKKIKKTVMSPEFLKFIKELQEFIQNGGVPQEQDYTSEVMEELGISKDKKMRFTPVDVK